MHDTPPTRQRLLTSLADMLYVPMLFYVLTQWEKIKTVPARLLWFGLFVLIKNELMSVRDSYRVYSVGLYLLDFGSLLTCLFAVDALTRDIKPFRYDPEFWYFLAVLWALYATWDIMMFYKEEAPSYRKQLKVWTLYMVSASCMTLICAMVLQQVGTDLLDHKLLHIPWRPDNTWALHGLRCRLLADDSK